MIILLGPLVLWLWPTYMLMLLRVLATAKEVVERENGKGKPRGKGEPKKVTGETSEQQDHYCRCEGTGHWSHNCSTLKHLVELYQSPSRSKDKESQHEPYFTAEPDATKHGDMLVDAKRNGEDVQMDESEDDLLDDNFDIFRDLQ